MCKLGNGSLLLLLCEWKLMDLLKTTNVYLMNAQCIQGCFIFCTQFDSQNAALKLNFRASRFQLREHDLKASTIKLACVFVLFQTYLSHI